MPTAEKAQEIKVLEDKLSRAKGAVLADFRGLNVSQITKLRGKLREAGVDYKVSKNTLLGIAAHNVGITGLEESLNGPTSVALSYDDPVLAAKLISDFAKENKSMQIKAGLLNNTAISKEQVMDLANLPSREVLLAQLLSVLNMPLTNLANVLSAPTRNLVYALEAVRKQKAGEA